jgi:hypothetical protein
MRKRFGFMQIAQAAGQFYMPIFAWQKVRAPNSDLANVMCRVVKHAAFLCPQTALVSSRSLFCSRLFHAVVFTRGVRSLCLRLRVSVFQLCVPVSQPWTGDASTNSTEWERDCDKISAIQTNHIRTCDLAQKVARIRVPIDTFERTLLDAFDMVGYRIDLPT